jgi:integrase/recombinase XerD
VTALAPALQAFFTDRLARQRHASPQTIAAYCGTWRLLLAFAAGRAGKQPSKLDIADLDAPLIGDFLDYLERDRGNSPRTRNARLAAIHSMFAYAALRHPEHAESIARVLAIPAKRFDKALVTWLTEPEVDALLAAPDKSTWAGRRDHAMIALAAQTGLRISELTGLTIGDVHLGAGPHVSCHGKGRKERITPLARPVIAVLRSWLAERHGDPGQPLFPNRTGGRLSRDAIEKRLAQHVSAAAGACPSLKAKNVTAHTLRHTAAMRLQRRGVASGATFRNLREDGTVRAASPARLGDEQDGRAKPAGQDTCDRTVPRWMPRCCIQSCCISAHNNAAEATKNRSDEGRCHHRLVGTLTHSAWLVNRSLPVSTPAPTPRSSRSGSATSRPTPPRSTSTPTSPSRRKHSRGPPRSTPSPAATSPRTTSSPSSKASDYADLPAEDQAATRHSRRQVGITRRSA